MMRLIDADALWEEMEKLQNTGSGKPGSEVSIEDHHSI